MLMSGEILAGLASTVLPGLGAQAAAQTQRRWALEDLARQNEYNSPRAQLQRLKDAGLPAAAFFSGGVSSQSDMPRSTNVDPTMGVAQGVNNFFTNRLQSAQIKGIEAENRSKVADADIKEAERNWLLDNITAWKVIDPNGNVQQPPLITRFEQEQRKGAADADIAVINRDIRRIDASYANDKSYYGLENAKAELQRTLSQTDLLKQQFKNVADFTRWQKTALDEWERGGVSALELFIYQLLYGRSNPAMR